VKRAVEKVDPWDVTMAASMVGLLVVSKAEMLVAKMADTLASSQAGSRAASMADLLVVSKVDLTAAKMAGLMVSLQAGS